MNTDKHEGGGLPFPEMVRARMALNAVAPAPVERVMEQAAASERVRAGGVADWHCNKCGRDFSYNEAESVEVSPTCEECVIACPSCLANILDDGLGALSQPNVRVEAPPSEGEAVIQEGGLN